MIRIHLKRLLLPLALLIGNAAHLAAQCEVLVWADEFDGTELDTTKWSYQIGDGCPDLCGWGNNEKQYYRPENVELGGGTLRIIAKEEVFGGRAYTSGRIRSLDKGEWTTGRIEARMKLPFGQGYWPAFWMLPSERHYGIWPLGGEIDIMEVKGSEPEKLIGSIHYGPLSPANQYSGGSYVLPSGTFADGFHTFAVHWVEDTIRWIVDDVITYSIRTPESIAGFPWRFDRDFHLLLNIAVGGWFPGDPDATTVFPQALEVDYVRVYQTLEETTVVGREDLVSGTQAEPYRAQQLDSATYTWTAPPGAVVASGQGTPEVTVDWGTTGGELTVEIATPGCTATVAKSVRILHPDCRAVVLDFEDERLMHWTSVDGPYRDTIANPAPDAVNGSSWVGRYTRNGSVPFSLIRYVMDFIGDATPFADGDWEFEMDVYTDAPPGTLINLQLERNPRSFDAYPAGRHSIFSASTSMSNQWERLRFVLSQTPDGTLDPRSINQFLILPDPASSSANTYYYDNLAVVDADCATTGLSTLPQRGTLDVYPVPASDRVWIDPGFDGSWHLQVFRPDGRAMHYQRVDGGIQELSLTDWPAGLYFVTATSPGRIQSRHLIIH